MGNIYTLYTIHLTPYNFTSFNLQHILLSINYISDNKHLIYKIVKNKLDLYYILSLYLYQKLIINLKF